MYFNALYIYIYIFFSLSLLYSAPAVSTPQQRSQLNHTLFFAYGCGPTNSTPFSLTLSVWQSQTGLLCKNLATDSVSCVLWISSAHSNMSSLAPSPECFTKNNMSSWLHKSILSLTLNMKSDMQCMHGTLCPEPTCSEASRGKLGVFRVSLRSKSLSPWSSLSDHFYLVKLGCSSCILSFLVYVLGIN